MENNKLDQGYIKKKNLHLVLKLIKTNKSISRADIVKMTNMSPTSVSRIVGNLIDLGLVRETETYSKGVGRKAILLEINLKSILTVGAYINKHIVKAGIVDFGGGILYEEKIESEIDKLSYDKIINIVCELIKKVINNSGVDESKIVGLGISLPGIIDYSTGNVLMSTQLKWKDIQLGRCVEEKLGIKTIVDNDVKVEALAESIYGVGKNIEKLALISFGRGVGSALIVGGNIFRGTTNIAGEIGHTTIDPNGALCPCGRRGCLQTFIIEDNIIAEANKVKKTNSLLEVFEYAHNGEQWAVSIIDRCLTYMCITINTVICMYNPDTVVIKGSLIKAFPDMPRLVEEKLENLTWDQLKGSFQILQSQLGSKAHIVGGATLALNTFCDFD
ncbi:transcriptional regulator [Vallitalea longa]|uniref:Transcriptional regulator n=1 Tax=Vallitalea longa TaxID=2936439 RepID=A0A9W6DG75_9FIRM|nr:ROK family transcriptional regulator [Vallitalea longa]GKX30257.1 transcriptional regulator [Vallitalea longa]